MTHSIGYVYLRWVIIWREGLSDPFITLHVGVQSEFVIYDLYVHRSPTTYTHTHTHIYTDSPTEA